MSTVIDKTSETPRYSQLKAILKGKIRRGEFRVGDRIPPERELAELYDVSRITVTRAVRDMVLEGLLKREQGRGTFVSPRPHARSMSIATLVTETREEPSSYILEMFKGIQKAISARGYSLVFMNASGDDAPESAPLKMIREGRLDGLIVVEHMPKGPLARLRETGAPIVLLDWEAALPDVDCVLVDDRQATRLATDHLLGLGHRTIGFVGGKKSLRFYTERAAGYREALQAAGITYRKDLVCWDGPWFADGRARIKRMLARGVTAIAGASDCLVGGALDVMRNLGVKVPDEMSSVGLGGSPVRPESFLTTVRIDWVEMGRRAGRSLLARIGGSTAPSEHIRVPGRLLKGRSCAELDSAP